MTPPPPDTPSEFEAQWHACTEQLAGQLEAGARLPVNDLLLPLTLQVAASPFLRGDSLGFWHEGKERHWLPRFHFQRTSVIKRRWKLGIFAGIHGDEPAGILGLMDFVRELDRDPELGREFELWLYPLCNPSGYLAATRHCSADLDLNREFWRGSRQPEVQLLEKELHARQFDGIMALHSDDTSNGFYGFARDRLISEQMLAPALAAADRHLPLDRNEIIDGFHAVNGIIHSAYDGILCAPPGQRPQPFEVILESPQLTPMVLQRRSFVAALSAILASYRSFMAWGGDL